MTRPAAHLRPHVRAHIARSTAARIVQRGQESGDVRPYLASLLQQAKAGKWTPYDYPYWALGIEKAWPAIEPEAARDESVVELLAAIAEQVGKRRSGIFGGEDGPRVDSDLVCLRKALSAPRAHWWFWPELIEVE